MASKWQTQFALPARTTPATGSLVFSGPSMPVGRLSPHYAMRVQFRGRRLAFTLGSGNKEAAAKIAASIYGELLAQGVEATLARHRVQKPDKPAEVATVGQWIAAAEKVFDGKPSSFVGYARALRLIAAEVKE